MKTQPFSWARTWRQLETAEERAEAEERWKAVCSCDLAGPDADGNYDLVENDACPVHGTARHG